MSQIIPDDLGLEVDEAELCFSEDEEDGRVDKLVSLINEGSGFRNENFEDGASKEDLARMRAAAEAAASAKKRKKRKIVSETTSNARDAPASAVAFDHDKFKADIIRLEAKVDGLRDSFDQTQDLLKKHMLESSEQFIVVQRCYQKILDAIAPPPNNTNHTSSDGNHPNTSMGTCLHCTPADTQTRLHSTPVDTQTRLHRTHADPSDLINSVVANVQESYGEDNTKVLPATPTKSYPFLCVNSLQSSEPRSFRRRMIMGSMSVVSTKSSTTPTHK